MSGSVRKAARDRQCDGCGAWLSKGTHYFATQDYDPYNGHPGPHSGWWYYCLRCAEADGHIAPVVREGSR